MVLEKESTTSSKSCTGTINVAHNVGIAIDKDKGSQHALKWAIENLICRGQTISLIHIKKRPSVPTPGGISHLSFPDILGDGAAKGLKTINADQQISELFLTFRAFCSRKEIKCNEIVLEDSDIARSLCDYARIHFIDVLVLGAPTRVSFVRFKGPDVPTTVTRVAPDFCSVYIVSKGKTLSIRQATIPVPTLSSQASTNNHDNNNSVVNPPTIHHDSRTTHHDHHDSRITHHDSRTIHHDHHDSRTTHHHHHDSRTTHHNHHDHHDSRTPHHHDHHDPRTPHHHDHHDSRTPHHIHHDHHDSRTPHHDHHDSRTPHHNHFVRGSDPASHTSKTLNNVPSITEDVIKSPFERNNKNFNHTSHYDIGGSDISFVSSDRSNSDNDFYHSSKFNIHEEIPSSRHITHDHEYKHGFTSPFAHREKSPDNSFTSENSSSSSTHNAGEMEAEMKRLKKELQQTIDMYSSACKEALSAKQRATELHQWKVQEHHKLLEAKKAEGAALAMAQREKEKTKVAIEAAEASKKVAEHEVQKRIMAEMMVMKESDHKGPSMSHGDTRYRKYSIDEIEAATDKFDNSRKIGEGGYGPVYKCSLDHTLVAVKVLRPDAAQGRSQFNQEVEVLCCIRHPNMVLLLGACPEYGCLVYEHMANGSLEDRLFCRGNSPVLSWQLRFRIAAEIATGLLFLHQTKPEPLVHRDLKPGNILLDRNFVSKISDVGLARLVPPTVANSVTQYRMTATAGTFCYIDPEYQQTGMLGIKSDIYSLGIMLLQIVTAKSPMGLAHQVERAIEQGNFVEMLDPAVQDWPVEEATAFAKMALKCAELRRRDRPDLKMDILPELNRLRNFSEDFPTGNAFHGGHSHSSLTSISLSSSSVPSQDSVGSDAFRSHGNRH